MRTAKTLLTIGVASLFFALAAESAPTEKRAEAGHKSFEQYCASCHGVGAKGDGPIADTLKAPPPDLTFLAARHGGKLDEKLVRDLIDGRTSANRNTREMPIWGERLGALAGGRKSETLVRLRIDELVAYLGTIQTSPR